MQTQYYETFPSLPSGTALNYYKNPASSLGVTHFSNDHYYRYIGMSKAKLSLAAKMADHLGLLPIAVGDVNLGKIIVINMLDEGILREPTMADFGPLPKIAGIPAIGQGLPNIFSLNLLNMSAGTLRWRTPFNGGAVLSNQDWLYAVPRSHRDPMLQKSVMKYYDNHKAAYPSVVENYLNNIGAMERTSNSDPAALRYIHEQITTIEEYDF